MNNHLPFGRHGGLAAMMRYVEQEDIIRRAIGPSLAQRSLLESPQNMHAALNAVRLVDQIPQRRWGIERGAADEALWMRRLPRFEQYVTNDWIAAIRKTAIDIYQDRNGILNTHKALISAAVPEWEGGRSTFDSNKPAISALMASTNWSARFRLLSERITPDLASIRMAAERVRMSDAMKFRATAGMATISTSAFLAEQVLEAHRLIEAMDRSDGPEQSAGLFVALVGLMSAIVQRFGGNTAEEISKIGAIKLFEIFLAIVMLAQSVASICTPAAERKVIDETNAEVENLKQQIETILQVSEIASEAYIGNLPRAELRRDAAIRREPHGKAQMLIRLDAGTEVAVEERCGNWQSVVYRDPLTEQLSAGWVFATAVQLHSEPERYLSRLGTGTDAGAEH